VAEIDDLREQLVETRIELEKAASGPREGEGEDEIDF